MQLLEQKLKPCTLLSLSLSDIIESPETEPTFTEIVARVLYHTLLRTYYVSPNGRYNVDINRFEMLFNLLRQFSGMC